MGVGLGGGGPLRLVAGLGGGARAFACVGDLARAFAFVGDFEAGGGGRLPGNAGRTLRGDVTAFGTEGGIFATDFLFWGIGGAGPRFEGLKECRFLTGMGGARLDFGFDAAAFATVEGLGGARFDLGLGGAALATGAGLGLGAAATVGTMQPLLDPTYSLKQPVCDGTFGNEQGSGNENRLQSTGGGPLSSSESSPVSVSATGVSAIGSGVGGFAFSGDGTAREGGVGRCTSLLLSEGGVLLLRREGGTGGVARLVGRGGSFRAGLGGTLRPGRAGSFRGGGFDAGKLGGTLLIC